MRSLRSVNDLTFDDMVLFVKRFKENINDNVEDLVNALNEPLNNLPIETYESLGLRYDSNSDSLLSVYPIHKELYLYIELNDGTEFELHDKECYSELKRMTEYLSNNNLYEVKVFESDIFDYNSDTDLHDILELYTKLQSLNLEQQKLFVEIFTNGYADSPLTLVQILVWYLKDW